MHYKVSKVKEKVDQYSLIEQSATLNVSTYIVSDIVNQKDVQINFKPCACCGVRLVSWNCFSLQCQCVCVYMSALEAINYIHVMYNQLNKFVMFRNLCMGTAIVTKHIVIETNLIRLY